MSRTSTICVHPHRAQIDASLVSGTLYRNKTQRFAVGYTAVARHCSEHLLAHTAQAHDLSTTLADIREARSCLELEAKIRGTIDDKPTINILLGDPTWPPIFAAICASPAH